MRELSTDAEIDAAMKAPPGATVVRLTYAAEVWPRAFDQPNPDAERKMPPHAIIHGLRKERDHYARVIETERRERRHAEHLLSQFVAAAQLVAEFVPQDEPGRDEPDE